MCYHVIFHYVSETRNQVNTLWQDCGQTMAITPDSAKMPVWIRSDLHGSLRFARRCPDLIVSPLATP